MFPSHDQLVEALEAIRNSYSSDGYDRKERNNMLSKYRTQLKRGFRKHGFDVSIEASLSDNGHCGFTGNIVVTVKGEWGAKPSASSSTYVGAGDTYVETRTPEEQARNVVKELVDSLGETIVLDAILDHETIGKAIKSMIV